MELEDNADGPDIENADVVEGRAFRARRRVAARDEEARSPRPRRLRNNRVAAPANDDNENMDESDGGGDEDREDNDNVSGGSDEEIALAGDDGNDLRDRDEDPDDLADYFDPNVNHNDYNRANNNRANRVIGNHNNRANRNNDRNHDNRANRNNDRNHNNRANRNNDRNHNVSDV